jgi:hypothetical protein
MLLMGGDYAGYGTMKLRWPALSLIQIPRSYPVGGLLCHKN